MTGRSRFFWSQAVLLVAVVTPLALAEQNWGYWGLTVAAVFVPSRAQVRSFAPLHCHDRPTEHCLEKLWDLLAAHPPDKNPHRPRRPHSTGSAG